MTPTITIEMTENRSSVTTILIYSSDPMTCPSQLTLGIGIGAAVMFVKASGGREDSVMLSGVGILDSTWSEGSKSNGNEGE
jgi:hypothetical protein